MIGPNTQLNTLSKKSNFFNTRSNSFSFKYFDK